MARTQHTGTGAGTGYYHSDGNGNVTAMLAPDGQSLLAAYLYDPYGRTLQASGTWASANVYRFSSKEQHAASGLYYYGFRFYSPNLQRWVNRDPIQEYGGINLYGFVGNRPVGMVDAFGLCAKQMATEDGGTIDFSDGSYTDADGQRWPLATGNVPGVVENAVGGLAAEQTGSAVEITNQTHQTHEETKAQSAGRSQHQIV